MMKLCVLLVSLACASAAAPCSTFVGEPSCLSNAGCTWNAAAALCGAHQAPGVVDECETFKGEPSCLSNAGCTWNAAAALCSAHQAPGVVDECVAECPTCAGDVCSKAGQVCVDPNIDASSVADWMCECVAPATGSAIAAPAVCSHPKQPASCDSINNEVDCRTSDAGCMWDDAKKLCDVAQLVEDKMPSEPSVGAPCATFKDEPSCLSNAGCTWNAAAALCGAHQAPGVVDANPSVPCIALTNEVDCKSSDADCVWDSAVLLCQAFDKAAYRNDAEPGLARLGAPCATFKDEPSCLSDAGCTWMAAEAVCKGQNANQAPKVVDECVAECPTCAGDVCSKAGQVCVDPNIDSRSVADWMCLCAWPATGSAIAAPAVCQE